MKEIRLRPYQQQAIDDLRRAYAGGARRPLFVLPTGGGKTFVFAYIAGQAAARGGRVVVLVHRQELLRQASASLSSIGVRHGLIAPGEPFQPREAVQVASVQTLVRRLHRMDMARWSPSLIIIDEAHHATAGTWSRILDHWPSSRALGVTATPVRGDGQGLDEAFDAMVQGPQISQLIDTGHLVTPEVYAPPMVADLSGVRIARGDYARGQAADAMDKPRISGDAVTHYERICRGQPAIAFCCSVAHAEHVAERFTEAGWMSASIDGTMSDGDRAQRISDLGSGALHVLTSCDIVSEGTDIPVVSAAILLRPTQSEGLYLQQVGRVLRPAAGKRCAYIIDHVGNVQRHGMPDEDRAWSLAGRAGGERSETGPPPPSTCERCFGQFRVVPKRPDKCPICGAPLPVVDRGAQLEVDDGAELVKVDEAHRRAIRRQRAREEAEATTLDALIELGASRGYKPGWARHRWEARQRRAGDPVF